MLTLDEPTWLAMVAHAYDCLPYEMCGLVAGPPGSLSVTRFYPCANAAASAKVFTLDGRDHLRADRDAEDRGLEVLGVAHSHSHTPAHPSPTDVAQAPDPAWHYLIVSLVDGSPALRSWRIEDGNTWEEAVVVLKG